MNYVIKCRYGIETQSEEKILELVKYGPDWLSDEVCRAVSGGAFSKRKNYTDDDEIPYKYKKILSFSGINIIFSEPDALDRSIKIELERIKDE